MTPFVQLPDATSMLASVASSSQPMFAQLFPIGMVGVGFVVGALVVVALITWIEGGIGNLVFLGERRVFHKKDQGWGEGIDTY